MAFYEVTRIMLDPITISVIASGALAAAITLGIAGCVLYKKTRETGEGLSRIQFIKTERSTAPLRQRRRKMKGRRGWSVVAAAAAAGCSVVDDFG